MLDKKTNNTREVQEDWANHSCRMIFFLTLFFGFMINKLFALGTQGTVIYGVLVSFFGWLSFYAKTDIRLKIMKLLVLSSIFEI